jgi:hypothetical protein
MGDGRLPGRTPVQQARRRLRDLEDEEAAILREFPDLAEGLHRRSAKPVRVVDPSSTLLAFWPGAAGRRRVH